MVIIHSYYCINNGLRMIAGTLCFILLCVVTEIVGRTPEMKM